MAQFIASMIECGGMTPQELYKFYAEISERVAELLNFPNRIWPELLPGGQQVNHPFEGLEDWERKISVFNDLVETAERDELEYDTVLDWILDFTKKKVDDIDTVKVALVIKAMDESWVVCRNGVYGRWTGTFFETPYPLVEGASIEPGFIIKVASNEVYWYTGWHDDET